ncbi:SURF1 family protein [Nocardioides korecus]
MLVLLRPRYWGAHLLLVLAVVAAILLGLWQLHVWSAARNSEALDLTRKPAVALTKVMGGDDPFPGQYLGQPVTFTGSWMPKGTVYVADRDLRGRRGYWVVTPVLVGRSAMPVVRGWSSGHAAPAPRGTTTVDGWLQPSEGTGAVDGDGHDDVIPEMRVASMVEHVDADLYSGFVVARQRATAAAAGASSTAYAGLLPVTPESIPEVSSTTSLRNLLYAFQWWIFGGFAVYIWLRWCRDTLEDLEQGTDPGAGPDPKADPDPAPGAAGPERVPSSA